MTSRPPSFAFCIRSSHICTKTTLWETEICTHKQGEEIRRNVWIHQEYFLGNEWNQRREFFFAHLSKLPFYRRSRYTGSVENLNTNTGSTQRTTWKPPQFSFFALQSQVAHTHTSHTNKESSPFGGGGKLEAKSENPENKCGRERKKSGVDAEVYLAYCGVRTTGSIACFGVWNSEQRNNL